MGESASDGLAVLAMPPYMSPQLSVNAPRFLMPLASLVEAFEGEAARGILAMLALPVYVMFLGGVPLGGDRADEAPRCAAYRLRPLAPNCRALRVGPLAFGLQG